MHTTAGQDDPTWPLPDGLGQAIRGTAEEIATLVRSARDTALAVPRSQWTVG